jgi:hypothetical protein
VSGARWFCSEVCKGGWREEVGEEGVEGVRACEAAIFAAGKKKKRGEEVREGGAGEDEVESAWRAGEVVGIEVVKLRMLATRGGKAGRRDIVQAVALVDEMRYDDDEDVLRFLLDGITRRFQEGHHPSPPPGLPTWDSLRSLVPTLSLYASPSSGHEHLASHIRIYHSLLLSLPLPFLPYTTPTTVLTLLTRDAGNSFGIWEQDPLTPSLDRGQLIAYALYPSSSYFNHSCTPTLSKERKNDVWEFKLKEDVGEGEELCISYLGGGESEDRSARREKLSKGWGFECACARCVREGEGEGEEEGIKLLEL